MPGSTWTSTAIPVTAERRHPQRDAEPDPELAGAGDLFESEEQVETRADVDVPARPVREAERDPGPSELAADDVHSSADGLAAEQAVARPGRRGRGITAGLG